MPDQPTFDLQSHSTCSDGELAPADVVARAGAAGVQLLALSDHDTVAGVADAQRAAREHGLRLTPATELSVIAPGELDLHVCGYDIDPDDAGLAQALVDWREDRQRRVLEIADNLERDAGLKLDRSELEARRDAGAPLGRPHLAAAAFTHPDNAQRLAGVDKKAFFEAYLVPGAPTYVPRTRPTPEDAVTVIHQAGGVAVWAHPFWDVEDPAEVEAIVDANRFDGLEVFYVAHDEQQTRTAYRLATDRGLLATGSADYHGPDHEQFNAFRAFELYGLEPRLGPIGAL